MSARTTPLRTYKRRAVLDLMDQLGRDLHDLRERTRRGYGPEARLLELRVLLTETRDDVDTLRIDFAARTGQLCGVAAESAAESAADRSGVNTSG